MGAPEGWGIRKRTAPIVGSQRFARRRTQPHVRVVVLRQWPVGTATHAYWCLLRLAPTALIAAGPSGWRHRHFCPCPADPCSTPSPRKPAHLAQPAVDDRAADPGEHACVLGPAAHRGKGARPRCRLLHRQPLPAIEVPRFVAWLEETGDKHLPQARALQRRATSVRCWPGWSTKTTFSSGCAAPLRARRRPQHADWTAARAQYQSRLPAPSPATGPWTGKDAEFRPITWLTATFLHGSTGHLLGNMLFLFLFGFSVELALGAPPTSRSTCWAAWGLGPVGLGVWRHRQLWPGRFGAGVCVDGHVCRAVPVAARAVFLPAVFLFQRHVTAPALLLLPAWIANELLQHWLSGRGVAYMAHLGGLLAGASLMAPVMLVRRRPWKCPRRRLPCPTTVLTPMWPTPSAWPRP